MKGVVLFVIALAAMTRGAALGAETNSFQPVHNLTTWYTDRTPIDIEIVGSGSMLLESHHLETARILRFRLERAYVPTIVNSSEPSFEIVSFSFDMVSGLPASLYFAVVNKGRFHENFAGIPILSTEERNRRTLLISLRSDESAAALQDESDVYHKCVGTAVDHALWILEPRVRPDCNSSIYPNGAVYVAEFDGDLALRLECQDESFPGMGCTLRFPFEGFAVTLTFHRDQLQNWRAMIDRASEFLRSKEYH